MINGRYIIQKKIGEGRSKVFSVIDIEFPEREVAAKFLSPNSTEQEKIFFREEFFTLQRLDHPNIIKAFELGSVLIKDEEDDEIDINSLFIIMEYFNPIKLMSYNKLKDETQLYSIIKQICSVLFYLHQSNYIYYDLKSENILVSDEGNEPKLKLIDFGFAKKIIDDNDYEIKGTPYYIAPEVLKNEPHDHRVDLYSFGVLLYRLVYGKFPYEYSNELEIYKAHLDEEIEFGESIYSRNIISIIEKLLKKNPQERFSNSLEVLAALDIKADIELTKDFIPAKVLSGRKDVLNIINTYINDENSNEVFTITGFDGAGKSSILNYIYSKYQNSILIENPGNKTGIESIKFILKKILLSEILYPDNTERMMIISEILNKNSVKIIESAKRLFNSLPAGFKLIILFDNYNLYDSYTSETLTELIRILQIKGIKVILSESSDYDQSSLNINNVYELQLNPFTEHHLKEFLDYSYISSFPKNELQKYIMLYSDLLPGNIKQFIKDLILLKVLQFGLGNITFNCSEDIALALQSSHEEIYRMRLSNLNSLELKLAQIISAFNISVEQTVLSALVDLSIDKLKTILWELEKKNIIGTLTQSNAPEINSLSFKKYIYSTINSKTKFHLVIANSIKKLFPDFNNVELARQFELAGEHQKAVEIINREILKAESELAFSYKRSLLEYSLKLLVSDKVHDQLYAELIKTLYKLSDYKTALQFIYNLRIDSLVGDELYDILFIKGSSQVELGETLEGSKILIELSEKTVNEELLQEIYVELAYAEFDLGNIYETEYYGNLVLNNKAASNEALGRILNLLSLVEFQIKNNPAKGLELANLALEKFKASQLKHRMAGILVNIGNYYAILGNNKEAQENWNKALSINSSIGNLEQESIIYNSYGVFCHRLGMLELSIEMWLKSINILRAIGLKNQLTSTYTNIGEVYSLLCDYQKSYDYLIKSYEMLDQIGSESEKISNLVMLGKLWYTLGDFEQLYKVQAQIEKLISKILVNEEQNYFYINILKYLLQLNPANKISKNEKLESFFEWIINNPEIESQTKILEIYSDYLFKTEQYEKLIKLFQSQIITKITEENIILLAYKNYFLGKVYLIKPSDAEKSPIDYFEEAYNILEGQSIYELTWKVLYEIYLIYYERGNYFKAKKPRLYAYELLNMIGENISNSKLRATYFNHPERKQALETLLLMGNQTQVNEYQQS